MTHHRNLGLFREIGPVLAAFLAPVLRCGQWLLATIPGVAPRIQSAIRYLNVTSSGRQWIANLYSNLFRAEQNLNLSGPQP